MLNAASQIQIASLCLLIATISPGCTTVNKRILLDVESATPLMQADLEQSCDLDDQAACILADEPSREMLPGSIAIIQGISTSNRAVFSALVRHGEEPTWFLYDRKFSRLWKLDLLRKFTPPDSTWLVQRIEVRDLLPDQDYELLAGDAQGRLVEDREFHTVSAANAGLRFALVSGLASLRGEVANAELGKIYSANPQLIIFNGGNVQVPPAGADKALTSSRLWDALLTATKSWNIFRTHHLIPMTAIWNEMEFGIPNDGPRSATDPARDTARETMRIFFPLWADEDSVVGGPGIASALFTDSQTLLLLDDRYFRSEDYVPPACKLRPENPLCENRVNPDFHREHQFGTIQTNWILHQAQRATKPVWFISADPWFGGYRPLPSFEGNHPNDFADFLSRLENQNFPPAQQPSPAILFASSGIGMMELMRVHPFANHNYETYELDNSSGGGKIPSSQWEDFSNPRREIAAPASGGFLLVNATDKNGADSITTDFFDERGKLLIDRSFTAPAMGGNP